MGSERQPLARLTVPVFNLIALVKTKTEELKILALTGLRDPISDGVWDYCSRLASALRTHDIDIEIFEANWNKRGWLATLATLRRSLATARKDWVLLQYTAMGWSRRGFPFGAVAAAIAAKRSGARVGVVFHEFRGFQAMGIWARFRFVCQGKVIRWLYLLSDVAIFTVPTASIRWLRPDDPKAFFIPIGSNIPENSTPHQRTSSTGGPSTVAVFCVTNRNRTVWEVEEIAAAIRHVVKSVPHIRLSVFGRGAIEAHHLLEKALAGSGAEISVLGVLPAEEVNRILSDADVLLYVRDVLNPQRGSAIAAVACGLPIAAYGDATTSFPLSEAGAVLARPGDRNELAQALERVLTDEFFWNSLHLQSLSAYKKYFAWGEIARRFAVVLRTSHPQPPAFFPSEMTRAEEMDRVSRHAGSHPAGGNHHPQEAPMLNRAGGSAELGRSR